MTNDTNTPATSPFSQPNTAQSTLTVSHLLGTLTDDFESDHNPVKGEISVWRAVITQALMDAASNSHKTEAKHEKRRATHWLLCDKENFETVCHYADLDPNYVRTRAKQALARNCRWRAEPGAKPAEVKTTETDSAINEREDIRYYSVRTKRPISLVSATTPPANIERKSLAPSLDTSAPVRIFA